MIVSPLWRGNIYSKMNGQGLVHPEMSLNDFKKKLVREVDKEIRKVLAPKHVSVLPSECPVEF